MKRDVALLFDIDGVVANVPHEKAWRAAALDWNLFSADFNFKKFYQKHVAGIPGLKGAERILEEYYKSHNIEEQKEKENIAKNFRETKQRFLDDSLSNGEFELFDDVISIIRGAKMDKIPIAAVSSSENAEKILKKANIFDVFDSASLGAIKHRALKKEHLYSFAFGRLCEKLKTNVLPYPIVFEDADAGIIAAKNLGYFCIGIAREGLATEDSLLKIGADVAYNEPDLQKKGYRGIMEDVFKSLVS